MKDKRAVVLFSCYFILLFSGCADFYKKDGLSKTPGLLEPASTLRFSDVPVPAGFNLLPQDSYSFETNGLRVGTLKYRGKASPEQVISFYKEQMPLYNWNLLNIIEYGERLINFDRENETCIIALLTKGNTVTITISLGPKPQVPAKKPKQPIK